MLTHASWVEAQTYLCIADRATGFRFDKPTKAWVAAQFDVTDEKSGKVESWGCEGNPPSTYSRSGVHRSDWRIGELVTMTCLVPKDNSKYWGFLKQIKYHSDGHVLVFRQGGN